MGWGWDGTGLDDVEWDRMRCNAVRWVGERG